MMSNSRKSSITLEWSVTSQKLNDDCNTNTKIRYGATYHIRSTQPRGPDSVIKITRPHRIFYCQTSALPKSSHPATSQLISAQPTKLCQSTPNPNRRTPTTPKQYKQHKTTHHHQLNAKQAKRKQKRNKTHTFHC
jgi:hypothetical protein